jgi:superfamily II DNA helicase RecQ
VTIVVSPLVALMFDQVHHLTQKGVDVAVFSSDQTPEQLQRTRSRLLGNGKKPNLLYLTPEKLDMSQDMRNIVQRLHRNKELARFVVDEAHCISTWGRDFRDAVRKLIVRLLRRI